MYSLSPIKGKGYLSFLFSNSVLLELPTLFTDRKSLNYHIVLVCQLILKRNRSTLLSPPSHRCMQASVNSLPVELLSEIFRYSLPEFPCFRSEFAPLLLTQVCQQWRTVALETHDLWEALNINNAALRRKNILPLLRLWLERSGSRTIAVDVDISILDGIIRNPSLEEYRKKHNVYRTLLATISPHRHRIHSLKGTLPMSIAADLGFDGMDTLEVMDLVGISEVTDPSRPLYIDLSKRMPKLKFLSLENIGLDQQSLYSQSQLSRLELSDMRNPFYLNCQTAVDVLKSLPNLQTAYIGLNRANGSEIMAAQGRINLPILRSLYVSWDAWEINIDTQPFFEAIATPNLERLALRGGADTPTGLWDTLLRFITSSGRPPLTHLAVGDMGATDVCLLDVLRATPTLIHLVVNHALVSPLLLRGLVWDPHHPDMQVAPRLKSIRFGGCEDFEDADIIPVLESRVNHPGKPLLGASEIEDVELRQCAGLHMESEKYIRRLGIPKVVLDSDNTLTSPFGGLLNFLRVVETHRDFFQS